MNSEIIEICEYVLDNDKEMYDFLDNYNFSYSEVKTIMDFNKGQLVDLEKVKQILEKNKNHIYAKVQLLLMKLK